MQLPMAALLVCVTFRARTLRADISRTKEPFAKSFSCFCRIVPIATHDVGASYDQFACLPRLESTFDASCKCLIKLHGELMRMAPLQEHGPSVAALGEQTESSG